MLVTSLRLKTFEGTVKPVYNDHLWDLKKVAICNRGLIKVRVRLVVNESNRLLLTGGCCSEVVVKAGLTVQGAHGKSEQFWMLIFNKIQKHTN
jgi:hypothetical protein